MYMEEGGLQHNKNGLMGLAKQCSYYVLGQNTSQWQINCFKLFKKKVRKRNTSPKGPQNNCMTTKHAAVILRIAIEEHVLPLVVWYSAIHRWDHIFAGKECQLSNYHILLACHTPPDNAHPPPVFALLACKKLHSHASALSRELE